MSLRSIVGRAIRSLKPPSEVALKLLEHEREHGEVEIALLPHLLAKGGIVVDVGANSGVYALESALQGARVFALEAHPDKAEWLRRALGAAADVLPVAASDRPGLVPLEVPVRDGEDVVTRSSLQMGANPGFEVRTVNVVALPLDDLGLPGADLLKIDVEGHELAVLSGAAETIRTHRPICVVECEERHNAGAIARMREFFEGLGFEGHYVHRRSLKAIATFDPAELQQLDQSKAIASTSRSPDYINNFIFVHAEHAEGRNRLARAVSQLKR